MDPRLWQPENYKEFLESRRELLAKAANEFLDSLLAGSMPDVKVTDYITDRKVSVAPGGAASEDEQAIIFDCLDWIVRQNLPEGELLYEVTNPETGLPLAVIDLAWPNGLQEGLSEPVALLIDEDNKVEEIVNAAGYRFFTDAEAFKDYVRREILAEV